MSWLNWITVPAKEVFGIGTGKKPYPESKIQNFGKVDDNIYRGSEAQPEEYRKLKSEFGIKTVVDLTDHKDPVVYLTRKTEATKQGLFYVHIALSDSKYPTNEQVAKIISTVTDPNLYPIYVSCVGGRHRTGIFCGTYRVLKYGWNFEKVYAEMRLYDFYTAYGHGDLKTFMKDFAEKHKTNG